MNVLRTILCVAAIGLPAALPGRAAPVSQDIKLDYFGYRPADKKLAIFTADPGATVLVRTESEATAYTVPTDGGSIASKGYDGDPSGDTVWWVDFSGFAAAGTYHLYSPSLDAQSYDFEIRHDAYDDVVITALETFYLQRCNTPKESSHAGNWADPAPCHMTDTAVVATPGTTDYGIFDLTGGWHDAGDYNKYVWGDAAKAVLCLLRAYEDNPGAFADGKLDIPESGNGVPDVLDEVKWELDWFLKMRLPDGSVLHDLHVLGWDSDSPPSEDDNARYYNWYDEPNVESGSAFAGCCALGSRVFRGAGMAAYADTLKAAALAAWDWLLPRGDETIKIWAAAEIFRMDETVTSARNYVDGYYADNWQELFLNVGAFETHAAITYIQTPGAATATVSNMEAGVENQVDYIFGSDDLYANGMPGWSYHWGSNGMRAFYGMFLVKAAMLGLTGSHTETECMEHAQDYLHYMHGRNAMNMVYLSNMHSLGGEHSSFQFYHAWFGDSRNTFSTTNYRGKPSAFDEPAYPYFSGTDNLGLSDDNYSVYGPAPGFVPGGPNANYSGAAIPPKNAVYYNKYYRDWCENDLSAQIKPWEITENSIGYQGPYVCLGSYFMSDAPDVPALSRGGLTAVALGFLVAGAFAALLRTTKNGTRPKRAAQG